MAPNRRLKLSVRALYIGGAPAAAYRARGPQLKRDSLGGTPPQMQRLPQLKPTPVRTRHPLVYGAALFLVIALIAFIGRVGTFWVLSAAGLSIVMGVGAIAIALRAP